MKNAAVCQHCGYKKLKKRTKKKKKTKRNGQLVAVLVLPTFTQL